MWNVVFEYTEGELKGGRYWTSYKSKEEFEERKKSGKACNSNEKIVSEGISDNEAIDLCDKTIADMFLKSVNKLKETQDPLDYLEAVTRAFALNHAIEKGNVKVPE